ncbi:MAG: hypothetical protein VYE27_08650 [Pseudomonadota bacterium]|nr:hypothetical protein [Pseudomonadota bacterium]
MAPQSQVPWTKVRGLLSQMGMDDGFKRKGASLNMGGVGLGPWTFRFGSVDSFGWSFD